MFTHDEETMKLLRNWPLLTLIGISAVLMLWHGTWEYWGSSTPEPPIVGVRGPIDLYFWIVLALWVFYGIARGRRMRQICRVSTADGPLL